MYVVTLWVGKRVVRSCHFNRLSIAGKIYANPGMLVPREVLKYSAAISLQNDDPQIIGGLRRSSQELAWLIGVDGSDYEDVHDLEHWRTLPVEDAHKELLVWYPDLDPWRALSIAYKVHTNMKMNMSIWVALDEIEVYPKRVEIRQLALEQARDQNE